MFYVSYHVQDNKNYIIQLHVFCYCGCSLWSILILNQNISANQDFFILKSTYAILCVIDSVKTGFWKKARDLQEIISGSSYMQLLR